MPPPRRVPHSIYYYPKRKSNVSLLIPRSGINPLPSVGDPPDLAAPWLSSPMSPPSFCIWSSSRGVDGPALPGLLPDSSPSASKDSVKPLSSWTLAVNPGDLDSFHLAWSLGNFRFWSWFHCASGCCSPRLEWQALCDFEWHCFLFSSRALTTPRVQIITAEMPCRNSTI